MNIQEYYDIREKIGFTVDLYRYAKNIGEVIDAYPILKKMSLEDVEQWLKDRQFKIDQEIQEELVDDESIKEKRGIKELNEAIEELSKKLSDNIDIQFNELNLIQPQFYNWIKNLSECNLHNTSSIDEVKYNLDDKWEITFDASLLSLFKLKK